MGLCSFGILVMSWENESKNYFRISIQSRDMSIWNFGDGYFSNMQILLKCHIQSTVQGDCVGLWGRNKKQNQENTFAFKSGYKWAWWDQKWKKIFVIDHLTYSCRGAKFEHGKKKCPTMNFILFCTKRCISTHILKLFLDTPLRYLRT